MPEFAPGEKIYLETFAGQFALLSPINSRLRLRDDERMRFQLAPVKYARPLYAALLGIFRLRFILGEIEQQTRLHFALLHLRHSFFGVIEPFAGQSLTVFR